MMIWLSVSSTFGNWRCLLLVMLASCNSSCSEWFSSLGQMEDLVDMEQKLLNSLQNHINHEKRKLEILSNFYDLLQETKDAEKNVDKFLSHPINQYQLIKRMSLDWSKLADVAKNSSNEFVKLFSQNQHLLPGDDDLEGTAEALMRLQDTYQIKVQNVMTGDIKGHKPVENLTLEDCYHIGRTAYFNENYYHCAFWMQKLSEIDDYSSLSFSKFDVFDHLAYCLAKEGLILEAFNVTEKILEFEPNHERLLKNVEIYKSFVGDNVTRHFSSSLESLERKEKRPHSFRYEELCRKADADLQNASSNSLRCYYWTNHNHPRLLLQPIKTEVLWDSPQLVRFYDVVGDAEIEELKALAKPHLDRATVHNPETGRLEHAFYRVSKSAWFGDEIPLVEKISRRITDITGLSMESAESLQVANYGMGGQYEPHFDIIRNKENVKAKEGNRIATFMFYLSDVDYGGSTVFLHPGLSIKPIKGSAVFWFNLFPSGEGDWRTRHAACPVLVGIKWVANKWIHERSQEFLRLCGMEPTSEGRLL